MRRKRRSRGLPCRPKTVRIIWITVRKYFYVGAPSEFADRKKTTEKINFSVVFLTEISFLSGIPVGWLTKKNQLASGLWKLIFDVDPSGKTIIHRQKKWVPRPKKKTHGDLDKYMNINHNPYIKIQVCKAYINSPSKFSTYKFIQTGFSNIQRVHRKDKCVQLQFIKHM